MSDGFSLNDALSGQGNANNQQSQGQNWNNNPWGGQNPGQPGQQGYPGQQYPGFPPQGPGQQNPGFPGAAPGQQYPGFPGSAPGQQYPGFPGTAPGQQNPGFPGAAPGQQYPGYPSSGQQFPGYPGAGQQYPGAPTPGQGTTDPKQTVPSGPRKVPCELPLPSGCVAGMMMTLHATPTGNRFNIDYKEGNNIFFHLNPRFDEKPNTTVRNSMISGAWGKEERECQRFPFIKGQPFKLQILFDPECFKVAVNNEQLCQFKHRQRNFSGIKCIRIDGDITISDATISMV